MATATLTTKGQITIPKIIREHLHITKGDRVEFIIDENGSTTIWPVTSDISELKGIIPKPEKPVSLEMMKKAIADGGSKI